MPILEIGTGRSRRVQRTVLSSPELTGLYPNMSLRNARDRHNAVTDAEEYRITGRFKLRNSRIIVAHGPHGAIARIEHKSEYNGPNPEYAGPLAADTLDALAEVSV
jgi:hypothetical protein